MTKLIIGSIIIAILMVGCSNNSGDYDIDLGSAYYLKGYGKAEEKLKEAIGKNLIRYSLHFLNPPIPATAHAQTL